MSLSKKYESILDKVAGLLLKEHPTIILNVHRIAQTHMFYQVTAMDTMTRQIIREHIFSVIDLISIIRQTYYSPKYFFLIWDEVAATYATAQGDVLTQFISRLDGLHQLHADIGLGGVARMNSALNDLATTIQRMPRGVDGRALMSFGVVNVGSAVVSAGGGGSGGGANTRTRRP